IGGKVDSGLGGMTELAERVNRFLGEDTPLGRLAHQLGRSSGHEQLQQALGLAGQGEEVLEEGRRLLRSGLSLLQGRKPEDAAQRALQWVAAFGREVRSAIKD